MAFDREAMDLLRVRADAARATLQRLEYETTKERMAATLAASETMGASFAFGVANGRLGGERSELRIGATIAADLTTGIALHAIAALLRLNGEREPHTAALGTGALAACAYRYGERLGACMRRRATAGSSPAPLL